MQFGKPNVAGRFEILDFYRGLGMLLVLLHHAEVPLGEYILAFHMPLFFILSGYTAHIHKQGQLNSFLNYTTQRFKRLIVPYLCFELLNLVLYLIVAILKDRAFFLVTSLISIVSCVNLEGYIGICGRLWFLPCMFMADIYVWLFKKATFKMNRKKQKIIAILTIIVLFILSWITCRFLPIRLPFTLDTAFMAASFILLGEFLGEAIDWLVKKGNKKWDLVLLFSSGFIFYVVVAKGDTYMHMYQNEYGHYPLTLFGALVGTVLFLLVGKYLYRLFQKAKKLKMFVLWYSYHPLEVFPIHLEIKWILIFLLNKVGLNIWLLLFLGMVIGCVPIANIITRYFPIVLGKYNKKSAKKYRMA